MMSEPNATAARWDQVGADDGEVLQFNQAEYTTSMGTDPLCPDCMRPIKAEYYEVNTKIVCSACRQRIEGKFRDGSPSLRLIKALSLGTLAAIVGAFLYYVILRVTRINSGLVSVLVGFLVGGAVRKGSGGRSGVLYQCLALFLTYSAITAMLAPFQIERLVTEPQQVANTAELIAFFCTLPVQHAIQAPISGVIYCFALWEAWRINNGMQLVFSGPFRVRPKRPGAV